MYIYSLLLLLWSGLLPAHQFHVSKSQIEYKPEAQALQISMHIFLDDLELAIEERGGGKLFLCTEKETTDAIPVLTRYLSTQFRIKVNGEEQQFNFLGKELSEDMAAIWCYMEVPALASVEVLEISNEVLMDLYDDQKNIVHIIGPGQQSGYFMMQRGNSVESVTFKE
ncbi:MAG: DUF6702 family protein [Bacteroidota bacterium]